MDRIYPWIGLANYDVGLY